MRIGAHVRSTGYTLQPQGSLPSPASDSTQLTAAPTFQTSSETTRYIILPPSRYTLSTTAVRLHRVGVDSSDALDYIPFLQIRADSYRRPEPQRRE